MIGLLLSAMDYSVLAIGEGTDQPLELFSMLDDSPSPAEANVRIRV